STGERMALYEKHAPGLAVAAVEKLGLGADAAKISHVVVTSCTGMVAPGIEFDLIERCGIPSSVERTNVGFMGCYAALNALKLARHFVRSEPDARVLILNLELCSLHLQQATTLEQLLSFLVFGDGCAASIVSADRVGVELEAFRAVTVPDTKSLITWKVRDQGFDMFLSGKVPGAIAHGLSAAKHAILDGQPTTAMTHWAVHPGGRSILDAVEKGLELGPTALAPSRAVLNDFGNMSSATVMFVLRSILEDAKEGERGCAMSFGPGLTAETMTFRKASA
ncbi:MAG: type III polyketide synthase, partial [Polyangiaceae bacterium]